jgi:hypothetical protein
MREKLVPTQRLKAIQEELTGFIMKEVLETALPVVPT